MRKPCSLRMYQKLAPRAQGNLINTPLQRGVMSPDSRRNRFSGFSGLRTTAVIALALLSAFVSRSHAQYNFGLYKNGQLITTFGPVGPATNAASKMLSLA